MLASVFFASMLVCNSYVTLSSCFNGRKALGCNVAETKNAYIEKYVVCHVTKTLSFIFFIIYLEDSTLKHHRMILQMKFFDLKENYVNNG